MVRELTMPIKVPAGLPALQAVIDEGNVVEILEKTTARTLRIALLNIMPLKKPAGSTRNTICMTRDT